MPLHACCLQTGSARKSPPSRLPTFSRKTALLAVAVSIAAVATWISISTLLSKYNETPIVSFGMVRTVGVEAYHDADGLNKTESLHWGTITPGNGQNLTLYLRNVSNVKTTLKPLATTNWNPSDISKYMKLSWDYDGAEMQPGDVVKVNLMLSAPSSSSFVVYLITNEVTHFSFEIVISAAMASG